MSSENRSEDSSMIKFDSVSDMTQDIGYDIITIENEQILDRLESLVLAFSGPYNSEESLKILNKIFHYRKFFRESGHAKMFFKSYMEIRDYIHKHCKFQCSLRPFND